MRRRDLIKAAGLLGLGTAGLSPPQPVEAKPPKDRCPVCEEAIDDYAAAFQCDQCQRWFHPTCGNTNKLLVAEVRAPLELASTESDIDWPTTVSCSVSESCEVDDEAAEIEELELCTRCYCQRVIT